MLWSTTSQMAGIDRGKRPGNWTWSLTKSQIYEKLKTAGSHSSQISQRGKAQQLRHFRLGFIPPLSVLCSSAGFACVCIFCITTPGNAFRDNVSTCVRFIAIWPLAILFAPALLITVIWSSRRSGSRECVPRRSPGSSKNPMKSCESWRHNCRSRHNCRQKLHAHRVLAFRDAEIVPRFTMSMWMIVFRLLISTTTDSSSQKTRPHLRIMRFHGLLQLSESPALKRWADQSNRAIGWTCSLIDPWTDGHRLGKSKMRFVLLRRRNWNLVQPGPFDSRMNYHLDGIL